MKKNIKKIFLILGVILVIGMFFRNKYYENKFSNYNEVKEEIIDIKDNLPNVDLEALASKDTKIKKIMENKDNYPKILLEMLAKNLDMTDYVLDYLNFKGQVFANNIGDVKKSEYPLLLQYDKRWGYGMYGDDVIAINGCGPTSLAMVIAGLTGKNNITPYDVAKFSFNNGYYDSGTSWSLFSKGVKNYGIVGKELPLSKIKMINELEMGHPIICSMSKGYFTTTGHIIVITGIKNGKFIINDPNSKERSNKLWSYEMISNQIKNLWTFSLN